MQNLYSHGLSSSIYVSTISAAVLTIDSKRCCVVVVLGNEPTSHAVHSTCQFNPAAGVLADWKCNVEFGLHIWIKEMLNF